MKIAVEGDKRGIAVFVCGLIVGAVLILAIDLVDYMTKLEEVEAQRVSDRLEWQATAVSLGAGFFDVNSSNQTVTFRWMTNRTRPTQSSPPLIR